MSFYHDKARLRHYALVVGHFFQFLHCNRLYMMHNILILYVRVVPISLMKTNEISKTRFRTVSCLNHLDENR